MGSQAVALADQTSQVVPSVVTASSAFGVLLSLHSVVYDDSNTGTVVLGTWT